MTMRVLAITTPRSRSNWITEILSIHYGIPYMYEPYRELFDLPHVIEDYNKITNSIRNSSGAMKIEITQLFDRTTNKLIDLSVFDLGSFDKIYTTERMSLVDMVCSHRIALEHDRWIFSKDNPAPAIDPITFNLFDNKTVISIKSCIKDRAVMKHVQAWMTGNNIQYTPLYYETMVDYAHTDLTHTAQSQWTATNYDYKTLFTNYDQIEEIIKLFVLKNPNIERV